MGCALCSFPCTGPRTMQACLYPSLRGWFRASQGESPGYHPTVSARAWVCCSACCPASGVVRPELGGWLDESQMWMTNVSASFQSLWCAAFVPLWRLRVCLRVGIWIFSLACGIVVFSDAFDAEAGFSQGPFSTALFCCILCVYWDIIPRACWAL